LTEAAQAMYGKINLICRKHYVYTSNQGEHRMLQRFILFAISIVFISTGAAAQNPSPKMPEHLRYYLVFRQVSLLNEKAVAAERKGEDGSKYRLHYKNFATLNDHQMSQLDQIANECLREVAAYDGRIKQLVNEARARIAGGKLEPGRPLPEPSAELKQIDAERDQTIRRAYTRLINAFGETEFKRFNERIEKSVRANPTQVAARAGETREHPTLANEEPKVSGITMIQEVNGVVQLYTATSIDVTVYQFYDAAIVGSIYEDNPSVIKAQAGQFGGMIAEVLLTTPAVPATGYVGFGEHYVIPYFYFGLPGWYDPYCFSQTLPLQHPGEMTWFAPCNCPCYVLNQYIFLGYTFDSIITQGAQQ
jgi:hypothetical protein